MTTATDPFVAVLTQRMIARETAKRRTDPSAIGHDGQPVAPVTVGHNPPAPKRNRVAEHWKDSPPPRPDYADDIDRMVRDLVAADDVVYDHATQAYRAPYCRRFKFGGVS